METFTKDFVKTTKGKAVKVMRQYLFLDCQGQGQHWLSKFWQAIAKSKARELPDISLLGRKLTKIKPPGIKYPDAVKHMTDEEMTEFGEDYLKTSMRYRTDRPYFIDKMPNNFAHIGFIKTILPNAKIINAKRHPLDSCVSSFKQLFYKRTVLEL